jgi:beta-glucosidase
MIRFDFPKDFLWGAAASAFQIEGGADADGRGPSVWDHYAAERPGMFHEGMTPAVVADFYHRHAEDVAMMRELGLKSFRFSISWSRVLPQGRGALNGPGLDFYDRLVDELLAGGIEPFVDLYHWDLPWALAAEGGFNNPRIVEDFEAYAGVCFERLGDRVRHWSTINEPTVYGHFNPFDPANDDQARLRRWQMHVLLMHFAAVRLYRRMNQPGKIGAVLAYVPIYPRSLKEEDQTAACLQQDLVTNAWLDPMLRGTYPEALIAHPHLAAALPPELRERIAEAFSPMDFAGINYYSPSVTGHKAGAFLNSETVRPYAAQSDCGHVVYPPGLYDALQYVRARHGDVEFYITENGYATSRDKQPGAGLDDGVRIDYIREHLREVARCLLAGLKVRGYYYWSLLDTYESTSGRRFCFGLAQVDYETLARTRRKSWHYYRECIARNTAVP